MSKHIFLISWLNKFRSIFLKKYHFHATLGRYFAGEFFWHKKFNKLTNYRDLEPLKGLELIFLVISPSDIFNLILEND